MNVDLEIGAIKTELQNLKAENAALKTEVAGMKALLNKGRGAVWVLGLAAAGVTFMFTQLDRITGALK